MLTGRRGGSRPRAPRSRRSLSASCTWYEKKNWPKPAPFAGAQRRAGVVEIQRAVDGHVEPAPLLFLECPAGPHRAGQPDAGPRAQIGRLLRHAGAAQELRTGDDDLPHLAEPQGDQRRVLQRADADTDVDAFVHQVDEAIEQLHGAADARIGGDEARDEVGHDALPEQHRRRDRQLAARRLRLVGEARVGLGHRGEDVAAAREVFGLLGQREPARVVRWNRRAPSSASSAARLRTTAGSDRPSEPAAAVRLPSSAICTKVRMARSLSIAAY